MPKAAFNKIEPRADGTLGLTITIDGTLGDSDVADKRQHSREDNGVKKSSASSE